MDLAISLQDAETRVIVTHTDIRQFCLLAEQLMQAMKLLGSLSADMAALFDAAVSRAESSDNMTSSTGEAERAAMPGGSSSSSSAALSRSILDYAAAASTSPFEDVETAAAGHLERDSRGGGYGYGNGSSETRASDNPYFPSGASGGDRSLQNHELQHTRAAWSATSHDEGVAAGGTGGGGGGGGGGDSTILAAAERLEAALNALDLPPTQKGPFPTVAVINKLTQDLTTLNRQNHELLAKLLPLEVRVEYIIVILRIEHHASDTTHPSSKIVAFRTILFFLCSAFLRLRHRPCAVQPVIS